jgi:hypothetical protein
MINQNWYQLVSANLSSSQLEFISPGQQIINCLLCIKCNKSKPTRTIGGVVPHDLMFCNLSELCKEFIELICPLQ